jgi:hypothetical protein
VTLMRLGLAGRDILFTIPQPAGIQQLFPLFLKLQPKD